VARLIVTAWALALVSCTSCPVPAPSISNSSIEATASALGAASMNEPHHD
jgi:hypothetical protein